MLRSRVLAAVAITSTGLIAWTQTAQAAQTPQTGVAATPVATAAPVNTPIGKISAAQYLNYCDDFGAHIRVSITGGSKSTRYTLRGTGFMQVAETITTNAAGIATIDLHNIGVPTGGSVGTATVIVSTDYYTTAVPAQIACSYGEEG
ncbi:MAG TPA: hypothetical protein VF635_10455 [Propionibacteriaceae bacterium]